MSSIVVAGDTSGTVTLQAQAVSGTTVLTLPTANGTVLTTATPFSNGQGPAFSASKANQNISSGVWTKVQCNTENFDTASCYDNATNFRFTPNVAGYYQITGGTSTGGSFTIFVNQIYKNGAGIGGGVDYRVSGTQSMGGRISILVYMNGTTDYVELYQYIAGTSPSVEGADFQGCLVRAA